MELWRWVELCSYIHIEYRMLLWICSDESGVKNLNHPVCTFWNNKHKQTIPTHTALRELHHQFILGDQSKFAPYVNYLKNQPRGRIPSEWTPAGKQLLDTILDRHEDELSGLPPQYNLKEYEETWMGECGEEDSDLARAAFYQFTSRDEDTLMVRTYVYGATAICLPYVYWVMPFHHSLCAFLTVMLT